jgi:hypothetical protein
MDKGFNTAIVVFIIADMRIRYDNGVKIRRVKSTLGVTVPK